MVGMYGYAALAQGWGSCAMVAAWRRALRGLVKWSGRQTLPQGPRP